MQYRVFQKTAIWSLFLIFFQNDSEVFLCEKSIASKTLENASQTMKYKFSYFFSYFPRLFLVRLLTHINRGRTTLEKLENRFFYFHVTLETQYALIVLRRSGAPLGSADRERADSLSPITNLTSGEANEDKNTAKVHIERPTLIINFRLNRSPK